MGCQAGLEPQECGRQERHRGQHEEGPGGPALLAALGQRQHEARQRQRNQQRAAGVEPLAMAAAGLGHHGPGGDGQRDADGQLGQEYRAPAEAERAPFHQRAAGELADGGCQSHHHAVDAEGLGEFRLAGEQRADRAEDLRHQHRRRDALQDAADDQLERRDGKAAEGVGGEEADHADEVEPAAAVEVAEAAAGDQEHGVGGGITGDDELQFGGVGADGGMDRRQADVDDEEVDRRQQSADDEDDERQPAPRGR